MSMAQEVSDPVYALLADGTTVEIRPAVPDDFDAVKAMHEAMSPDNSYLRFFNMSRLSAEIEARRICRNPAEDSLALLAVAGGEVVGVASYVPLRDQPDRAEVAFAVADHMHHRGIATLLLEHLVSLARSRQIATFMAETLTENKAMLSVFADAGLPVERHYTEGVIELTFPLPGQGGQGDSDSYLDAVAERERRADVASLRHIFAPESVAVIGASRRRGTVGRAILDNIRAGGYGGRLYTVNPRARQIGGERCLASPLDLPEPADLAVIALPAAKVLDVAEQCGQRGVRSLVVVTAGLDAAQSADLLAVCRRHGMRLVGPESFGVAVPGIGLDATFSARPARAGVTGLVMQSGGLGFALVDHLSRLGIGISSFASTGDKLDVSGNDMLLWWERDGLTRLAILYIESFGNPRKFARTARRVSGTMPVLTVQADTAASQALFEQAGVITTRGFGELVEAAALLATQPVPAGRTVAIVSNVGSAGQLAADACADRGLSVYHPHGQTRRRLRTIIPAGTVTGPVETTTPVSAEAYRQCLELLAADEEVDAIVAIALPTGATGDLEAAIQAADVRVPLAAVVLTQPEFVRLLNNRVPAYGAPEAAVRALARAAGYGAWRAAPRGQVPVLPDVRTDAARALVRERTGWLGPAQAAELLRCYGIPL
ncbi:MAG TPA: GNAT family N-acetyltransferase, partial [Streptosporangiaceae bacterium]